MVDIKQREIRWGRLYRDYQPCPDSKAFDLLISDAIKHGYLRSGFGRFGANNVIKTVRLDRFCREVLNAELIIGDSTGRVNGIRFSKQEDCIHFKMRVD